ncbi:DNA-binding protein [Galbibacter sp. PAP.153]|uniref:DNA-binding protein n=1 Tax=Galbibacter sp. PAP.153 TaxID=3104623 RepID=UPI00300BB266
MRNLQHKTYRLLVVLLLSSVFVQAQKQSKTYKESFDVNKDVAIDVNTSYADVEFDTWNKNKVEIEAVIEIEDVSKEEAEKYFKDWNFKATGTADKVSVSTASNVMRWANDDNVIVISDMDDIDIDFDFDFPDSIPIPPIPPLPPMPDSIMVMPPVPPMPPLPFNFEDFSFDYEAYKRDGDKYLKEWKEKFNKSFDDEVKANLDEWQEEVKEHQAEWQAHKEEMMKDYEQMRKDQKINRVELEKAREEAHKQAEKARKQVMKARQQAIEYRSGDASGAPNVFFYRSDSGDKNLKVKKTIKIKMPKGAKLKMNVRHGEVTLADNSSTINATLSYSRLHASNVIGKNSVIHASYSPILVDNWHQGELQVNYVESVSLKDVNSIKLTSKSSNVAIDNFTGDAIIDGSFGDLFINNISNEFNTLNIILDNSEARVKLPDTAFNFFSNASNSSVKFPKTLVLGVSKNYGNEIANGYSAQKNSNKTFSLVAAYSNVTLQ